MPWHIPCEYPDMMCKTSPQLLLRWTDEINRKNGLWALLWANEYLDRDDPLRSALATKALKDCNHNSDLKEAVLLAGSGYKAGELPTGIFAKLKSLRISPKKSGIKRFRVNPKLFEPERRLSAPRRGGAYNYSRSLSPSSSRISKIFS